MKPTHDKSGIEGSDPEEDKEPKRRSFNFMRSYIEIGAGIIGSYVLLYVVGYFALITLMLFIIVMIARETVYILENYDYGFVRKASVFNAIHAIGWFAVLAINAITLIEDGTPLILPQIPTLTNMAPLFILMALFGSRNISAIYVPDKKQS
ncbi:hypothetical protein EU537_08590 [Candidatus Thorarchaeota archaeon]|nr:MAG: hypothetical protein EU537_08590 [Candidatus Thorarchaeota archaeon]